MPFIVPVLLSMNAARKMQFKPSVIRINYLKNIYYIRITTYTSVFILSNLFY